MTAFNQYEIDLEQNKKTVAVLKLKISHVGFKKCTMTMV